jgi:hypothetical protein
MDLRRRLLHVAIASVFGILGPGLIALEVLAALWHPALRPRKQMLTQVRLAVT